MAQVMEMPKLSDTMSEGSIARWLKKEGDKVTVGVPIVEIETDKATMEYESPAGGVLLKILVGDAQKCPLQAPIAVIGKAEENWQEALNKHHEKKGGSSSASAKTTHQENKKSVSAAPAQQSQSMAAESSGRIKVTPLAKKVAQNAGIDLTSVSGSGPNGRIVVRDIENHSAPQSTSSQRQSMAEMEKIPLTNMRKTIARRLTESVVQAPHFYLSLSVNMTNLLAWRKQTLAKMPEDKKFSVNDLIIFLVARALKQHPNVNASWQDDYIVQYNSVHISVAVALPNGLMTPVVRNAHLLNVIEIAKETKRLIKLAKDGKLQPSDYAGGTFSISNLGMSGIEDFTAIINPPQAAILAIGSTIPTPVVNSQGAIVVEERMKLTLSCDHRVIDGLGGAAFLATLKGFFEDPISALLLN